MVICELQKKAIMAENKRFELLISCDIHAFQACALDHYANSPFEITELKLYKIS